MDGTAYIGLGSNLGERREQLLAALRRLDQRTGGVTAVSALYQTAPQYVTDQPAFLNAACRLSWDRTPEELLRLLLNVELALGRRRGVRYGPRTVDLDILLWGRDGGGVIDGDELTIPHPRLRERAFVLRPLADIAPSLCPPPENRTVVELAAALGEQDIARVADCAWARPALQPAHGLAREPV